MPGAQDISVDVYEHIARSFSKEYIEAVVSDALRILASYKDYKDTLLVFNARRVAVILDKQAQRGVVISTDLIEQTIVGRQKERLQEYLASPMQAYYVMHFPGSWFASEDEPKNP